MHSFYPRTSTRIKPELKRNILSFGYGINYKYEGMLAHSFGRFYVVTKFMLHPLGDLKFSDLNYENTFACLDDRSAQNKEIEPFVTYYKRLLKSYNNTAHNICEKEINLLLSQ